MAARSLVTLLLACAIGVAFAAPAEATLSIAAVDPSTGEVGVAAAACVQFDLARIATVVPGVGVAVTLNNTRPKDPLRLLQALRAGEAPTRAVDRVATIPPAGDGRLYAVVTLNGGAATHTETGAPPVGAEASGDAVAVVGSDLPRTTVVSRAKQAFEAAKGRLASRLMAALAASSEAGGDRRCHSQTATAAFIIVAGPGREPVVPIRGLSAVARRRAHVLQMVGKTVAADELGDLLRDAATLRRPQGDRAPDLYLSLIQPAHGFDAVELLGQAYAQLRASPTTPPSTVAATASTVSTAHAGGSDGWIVLWLGLGTVAVGGLWMRSRARRRRGRARTTATTRTRTSTR